MKHIIIIILFALMAESTHACLGASQNRLFPLGQTPKGLLVVETHLYRTEYNWEEAPELLEAAWGGTSYFKIYDRNYKVVYTKLLDSIRLFQEYQYDSIIGATFKKGMKLAAKYHGFIAAKPVSVSFCDYQEKCHNAALVFDSIHQNIFIRLPNKMNYPLKVLFDTTSIASGFLNYYERGEGDENEKFSALSLQGNLFINSVRKFQIGTKKLIVVHIGNGQIFEQEGGGTYPPGKEEYKTKFAFTDINKSVFEEPVLHHGRGFDFYIWE